jgi:hypothetical protein
MRTGVLRFNTATNFVLRAALILLAIVSALASALFTFVFLANTNDKFSTIDPPHFAQYASFFLCGWIIAAVLITLAKILAWHGAQVRQLHEQNAALQNVYASLQRMEIALQNQPVSLPPAAHPEPVILAPVETLTPPRLTPALPPAASPLPAAATDQLLVLLTQIRDLTMMSDTQRQQFAQKQFDEKRNRFEQLITRHIKAAEWLEAQHQIDAMALALPDPAPAQKLAELLTTERTHRTQQDLDAGRTQIQHLMSMTAWMQAEDVMNRLKQRYPDEPQLQTLAAELQHEREAFEKENFARLLAELKDANERREWRRALLAAQELIQRYPHDRKVEKLRNEQLSTIKENAEAQERKEEESLFKDLLQRQRYEDAAIVARRVIDKYPSSSGAAELSKLLPKVEELIRQEKVKRAAGVPQT